MTRAIRAAVSASDSTDLSIVEARLSDPRPNEVVVEVAACGICHTDLVAMAAFPAPAIFGHEGAGTVVATGENVKKVAIGDRVAMTFGSCGECECCVDNSPAYCWRHGEYNSCGRRPDGSVTVALDDGTPLYGAFFQQSSFANYALATERNVVKIPDALPFKLAAPMGCSIQTGVGAVTNQLRPQKDDSLVVFGAGAVGLSAIMAAKMIGVKEIVAVDPNRARSDLARDLGATVVIDPSKTDPVETIKDATRGGAHFSIDAAGRPDSFNAAVLCLRPRGVCGVMTPPAAWGETVAHPGGAAMMFTSLTGLVEGDSDPDVFLPQIAQWIIDGELPVDALVSSFPFEECNRALEAMRSGDVIKPVLEF